MEPIGAAAESGYVRPMQEDVVKVTIEIPASLADDAAAERAKQLLVLDAVRCERMSWRAAAEALGMSPNAFLDLAIEHGVPIVRQDVEDFEAERPTIERLLSHRAARRK